jgi:hypothetical protein
MAVLALLLIPNGRFLSPRWRYVAWLGAAITVALEILMVLDPMALQLDGLPLVPSPTAIAAFAGTNSGTLGSIGFLIGLAVIAAAAASVVLRLRRSHGEERLQLRWVAYSVALAVGVNGAFTAIAIVLLPQQQQVAVLSVLVVILGFGVAMPVGFAVAMLRYRLYDLDLLLNRTVLYSAVSIVLLVLFGLANLLAQRAVVAVVGERSDLVSASLGLAAGWPLRRCGGGCDRWWTARFPRALARPSCSPTSSNRPRPWSTWAMSSGAVSWTATARPYARRWPATAAER